MSDSTEPKKTEKSQSGGFGAFAQKYRDRWAANHPNAGQARPSADRPKPATPANPSTGES